ncbi:MAG: tripartite tricarboxylate transporter substrate-binding protein, partial [Betaproteobacteria bacterium]
LASAKARPGQRSCGSACNGSSPQLAAELMQSQAELFAVHVPYRGAAPALQDLLAGQIDFYFDPGIGLNQVRAGKLKLLAVGSLRRSPMFPDTPTLDEAGLRGFDADTVFGFYAPAGLTADAVTRLNAEINRALATPAVVERIRSLGGEPLPLSPAQFAARIADDSRRFGAIIRERNIRGD